jgi:glycine/D-amino acid oxidase-like deaminating enzyme
MEEIKHTVLIGGGVISATTAYYLSHHPSYDPKTHRITIIEAQSIAYAASGKAGGLLNSNAEMHTPETVALAKLSWKLHAELAERHDGKEKWWYRQVDMMSISCADKAAKADMPTDLETSWLNEEMIQKCKLEGTKEDSGQV